LYYEFLVADLNQDGQREIIVDTFDYTIVPSRAATKLLAYSLSAPTVISESLPLTQLLSGVCSTFNRCTNLQVIDINDDGWPDLLFGDAETPLTPGVGGMVSFMRQPGAGFVEGIQTQINGSILSPIDMDGDGLPDIPIIGSILFQTNFLAVALGNKALDFEYPSPYPISIEETLTPSAVAVVDINGDGKPDVVSNGANEGIVVMVNHKF
jgi:hypothetical protein